MDPDDALAAGAVDEDPEEDMDVTTQETDNERKMYKDLPFVKDVTGKQVDQIIMNEDRHVLVEFYAHWCSFCKQMKDVYHEVGAAFSKHKDVEVIAVNGDITPSALQKYRITGYPTVKLFRKGSSRKENPDMYDGTHGSDDIIKWTNARTGARGSTKILAEAMDKWQATLKKEETSEDKLKQRLGQIENALNTLVDKTESAKKEEL